MATKKTATKSSSSDGVVLKKSLKKTPPVKKTASTKKETTVKKTTKKEVVKKSVASDLFDSPKAKMIKEVKTKNKTVTKEDAPTKKKLATKKAVVKKMVLKKEIPVIKKIETKKTITLKKETAVKKKVAEKIVDKTRVIVENLKKEYVKDVVDEVRELPDRYNETKLVLMMRDPQWCYFYWDISDDEIKRNHIEHTPLSVKIFKLSGIDITRNEQHVEVSVGHFYGDFYINLNSPHTYFIAELGYYLDGKFIVLARSNIVYAPRDSISNVYDDEYMVNEELMKLFYDTKTLVFSLSSMSILQILELKGLGGSSSSSLFLPKKD